MTQYTVFTALVLLSFAAKADTILNGKVTSVIDGNTIEIITDQQETYKIILAGIDSPELNQEFGDQARRFLERLMLKKEVVIELQGKDRKGNMLGVALIKGKVDVRIELLKEGLAWTDEKNPHPELEAHRVNAQEKGKGLWKEANPIPPWTFRRQQSMLQPKSS
jgi:micrococcal nuclease